MLIKNTCSFQSVTECTDTCTHFGGHPEFQLHFSSALFLAASHGATLSSQAHLVSLSRQPLQVLCKPPRQLQKLPLASPDLGALSFPDIPSRGHSALYFLIIHQSSYGSLAAKQSWRMPTPDRGQAASLWVSCLFERLKSQNRKPAGARPRCSRPGTRWPSGTPAGDRTGLSETKSGPAL